MTRGSTSQGPGHLGRKLLKELRRPCHLLTGECMELHGHILPETLTTSFPKCCADLCSYQQYIRIQIFNSLPTWTWQFCGLVFHQPGHKDSERGWPGHTGLFIVTSIKSNILKDDGTPRWHALWKHLSGLKYLKPGAGLSGLHSLSWDVLSGFLGGLPNIWMKSHLCAAVRTEGAQTQAPLWAGGSPIRPRQLRDYLLWGLRHRLERLTHQPSTRLRLTHAQAQGSFCISSKPPSGPLCIWLLSSSKIISTGSLVRTEWSIWN